MLLCVKSAVCAGRGFTDLLQKQHFPTHLLLDAAHTDHKRAVCSHPAWKPPTSCPEAYAMKHGYCRPDDLALCLNLGVNAERLTWLRSEV